MVHISSHTQVAAFTSPAPMYARCRLHNHHSHNHHRGGPNTTKTTTITVVVPTRQKCRYSNPTRSWLFRISEWLFTFGLGAQYHLMKPKRMGKHQRKIQWHSGIESHKRSGGDADPPLSGNNEKCVCVTFPYLREGVLSVNSQIVFLKTFLSKRSFGNNSFCKVNSQVNLRRVWFGPFKSFSLLSDMI